MSKESSHHDNLALTPGPDGPDRSELSVDVYDVDHLLGPDDHGGRDVSVPGAGDLDGAAQEILP